MKPLIVANWKMNPQTYKEAEDLFQNILKHTKKASNVEIVLCPPFTWLTDFSHKNKSSILFGAQNVFFEEKGAYTGEISPHMLKSSKVDYVIVGHSERRKYFNETNDIINKKIKAILQAGLNPIFCIGENIDEDKQSVLEKQITEGLKSISRDQVKNLVIAYEPIWAIGTGNNCSINQTMSSILLIRKIISQLYTRELANNMKILYGGSVNSKNAAEYVKDAGTNGLLVGGASLHAEEFVNIVTSVS
jgi:triosephosphate isomerase